METKPFRLTTEQGLFGLAFLIALAVRLFNLGQAPLTDYEAGLALQSMDISLGKHILAGSQPALVVGNSALIFLFGASNFVARLIPALTGAALVLVPALFRRRLGRAAVIAGFLLAIDPGMVAVSRQVDGRMLALTFSLLSWGFFERKQAAPAGIFLGLALLGGPSVWLGGLILGTAWAINLLLNNRRKAGLAGEVESEDSASATADKTHGMVQVLPWVIGTLILAGSLFMLVPEGLSAIPASFVAFLQGGPIAAASIQQVGLALPVYAPLALVLAVLGLFKGILARDETYTQAAVWMLVSLLVIFLYQDRQVADLVWAAVPMLALAARFLEWILAHLKVKALVIILAGFIFVLLVFAWLQLVSALNIGTGTDLTIRLVSILGALIIVMLIVAMIGWGWSIRDAFQIFTTSACLFLLLLTLANTFRVTGGGPRPEQELWNLGPVFLDADLLARTEGDLSEWKTGRRDWLDLEISGLDRPSLRWLFRNQFNISFTTSLAPDSTSPMIITIDQPGLQVSSPYSGQDFVVSAQPTWRLFSAAEWVRWMVYREGPTEKESIVLWVRPNTFPGAAGTNSKLSP